MSTLLFAGGAVHAAMLVEHEDGEVEIEVH